MPEPDPNRKTAHSTRRISKADALQDVTPKQRSFHEAATVPDRIRRWQEQGFAEAVDPDVLSVRSRPRSEACRTPALSRSSSPAVREQHSTPRRSSTRWVQQENKAWVKQRRSVRGGRRSSNRQNPKQEEVLVENSVAEQTPPSEYIRTESLRTHNMNSSRAEREDRRRRRREARARANGGKALVDDGIRVYARSESHPPSEHVNDDRVEEPARRAELAEEIVTPGLSRAHSQHASDHHSQRSPSYHGSPENQYGEPDGRDDQPHQPTKYAQTLGQAPERPEILEQPKTRKQAILSKTREILIGKSDALPALSNRIPSIQAWLEEQPDPFFEEKEGITPLAEDIPKPLKHRSHRKKGSVEPTIVEVEDPNKIWDSVSPSPVQVQQREAKRSSRRQQRNAATHPSETSSSKEPLKRRLFSFEVFDDPSKGEDSTPPPPDHAEQETQSPVTLQRRGARTSRVKSKSVPGTTASPATPVVQSKFAAEGQEPPIESSNPPSSNQKPAEVSQSHEPDQHLEIANDRNSGPDRAPSTGLKRKLTTHEDLISVLSQPRARKSTRSVRSLRNNHGAPSQPILQELLETMRHEEQKYFRELRTLVDGVTPVLLQSLLSKTDAAATVGLFSDNNKNDANLTQPIIQMGVALERLKNLHNRIPLHEHEIDSLLSWASSAHKYYTDYVKWWRLGFQGVIVNLAPLNDSQTTEEDMLARDLDGDVTGADGQKVDVAYLQKRPLVKIKKFSKLITAIRDAFPHNDKAAKLAEAYADLTEKAKQRHSEEQGRLEDEAAANIDTTRARDIKTMAPITSVEIDRRRKVRARDCFNMTLYHSTGQRMDCRIEIILRDDPHPSGAGGDILICQVDQESKWLLFAPVKISNVSARRDESACDLVVMIKGIAGISETWYELLALKAEVPEAVVEWLHMLGSSPLPPKLTRVPSVISPPKSRQPLAQESEGLSTSAASFVPLNADALANLPSDVDVPIGEPSVIGSRTQKQATEASAPSKKHAYTTAAPKLSLGGGLQRRNLPEHYQQPTVPTIPRRQSPPSTNSQAASSTTSISNKLPLRVTANPDVSKFSPSANLDSKYAEPLVPSQQYSSQKFHPPSNASGVTYTSRGTFSTGSDVSRKVPASSIQDTNELLPNVEVVQRSWIPDELKKTVTDAPSQARDAEDIVTKTESDMSATADDRPRDKAPPIRSHTHTKSTSSTPLTETIKEQWAAIAGRRRKHRSTPATPEKGSSSPDLVTDEYPTPRAKPRHDSGPLDVKLPERAPPPPPHGASPRASPSPQPQPPSSHTLPQPEIQTCPDQTSPLKQEYQQSSSASGTESESDTDATSDLTSEEDLGSELKDQATPLVAVGFGGRRVSQVPSRPLPSVPSTGTRTLQPSDSASNGPYRRAPPPSAYPAGKKRRTIAMVCSWSDRGIWAPIQDDECSIVISPGLVQAFPMSAAHSEPMSGAEWEEGEQSPVTPQQSPLVEFELTPVVPLRKGTALDITIRSPPTANSTVRTTNNVMFRSRTIQECEKLYQLINWARCNNPTYAQLARSRAREEQVTFASNVPQSKSRSWFSFGSREKTSYRASSRPPSSIADTAASGSSATSAFSALKRFGKNSPFSLRRSSVIRRPGLPTVGESLYSSSNGTGPGSGTSTPAPSQAGFVPGPDGPNVPATSAEAANGGGMVNNMKIHLFLRQGQKWEQLGQCLLTVLPVAISTTSRPATPETATPPGTAIPSRRTSTMGPSAMSNNQSRHFRLPSSNTTPHKIHGDGREKRILITSAKRREIVMLDEILGESCFEKIMQTGIAVNVWKEETEIQEHGGVLTGRSRTYMIQFKTSTEATWVFNMCGTYRYGHGVPGA
ncbi:hypothetical protein H2198_000051 [Neophaeococcomyces mojaviensis]|uniref:Uncharacterized protein n=1 Tax=Neophaeococcomyces mojaviensis TaxID=3383035 RepID=A0ACC3ALE1_9EURO|nr:hypothetical protein H2198_000051 [Knufia sp. JES_112]